MVTRSSVAVLLCLVAALGAGCSSDEKPQTLDLDEPSSSGSDSQQSTDPTTGGGARESIPTSYPEVGLEFESLPKASGAKLAALETYVEFERGVRRLSRTAELNDLLSENAVEPVMGVWRNTVDYLNKTNTRYRGTASITVSFDSFTDHGAALALCTDGSDLELVTDGQVRPVEGPERAQGRVSLSNPGGGWIVTEYTTLEESC